MSESNFTKGRFQLRLLLDGNLVLNTRDLATDFAYGAYYETGTNNPSDNVGKQVVYSESGDMYILRQDGSEFDLILQPSTLLSTNNFYQRATLNYNGLLTWYSYSRASTGDTGVGWSEIQTIPDNICKMIGAYGNDLDSGACGYNSICNIDDNQKPVCKCPSNYSLVDPSDVNGDCEPDFKLSVCEKFGSAKNSEYELVPLQNTNFPSGDYARLSTSNEEQCKESCLNDCFCVAAVFSGSDCWKKKPPLSDGRHGSWEPSRTWVKVGLGNATSNNPDNNPFITRVDVRHKSNPVTTGILGASAAVNFILVTTIVLIIFFYRKRKQSRGNDEHQTESSLEHGSVRMFSYQKLESATNSFREEIGKGSFGVVYKGTITAGGGSSTTVAVKKLDRTFMGADKEFMAEVNAIGLTHHKNLVRFIGYCKEEDQRLLVYEYMPNGTVADYIFGDSRPSWQARVHIAQGVARGLLYLHEECTTQIIHCDIKPQNILVDDHYNARISDFGLAKILVLNQSQTNTVFRGTKGYIAPEWFKNKPVSVKVDVYSFGVLLLEIVCCRRCVCLELSAVERTILTDWAFDCYQSGKLDSLVNDDTEALNDRPRLERFVKVGLWCVQEDPNLRPTMQMINQMLEGVAEVPNPPCETSFSVHVQV